MFNYQKARESGYADDEILNFLSQKNPNFNVKKAAESGYSPEEITQFLGRSDATETKEKTLAQKAGRLAVQGAVGLTEKALLPYEIAVSPLAIPGGQEAAANLFTREILSEVYPTEEEGKAVSREPLKEPINLGVRSLLEKATGANLQPQGVLEEAASWMGFLKDPKKILQLKNIGIASKDTIKAILPSGQEVMRGLGAGTALEMAKDGGFGPIGTMAALAIGDIAGAGAGQVLKQGAKVLTQPKKTLAEAAARIPKQEKIDLQKKIIQDFRDSGIQADLGTLADSNLIKWTQSRLSQSGLTGKSLQEFKKNLTDQIGKEYKSIANTLGEVKNISNHEVGEILKEEIKKIREEDLGKTRELYKKSNDILTEKSFVNPEKLLHAIEKIEKELKPGALKSGEQTAVLNTLSNIKKDLTDSSGRMMFASVKDLMNNKIAINDIINYEVQGGTKQLLKGIVKELDRTIISYGKENPSFAKNYILANKKFSEHAKTFRNKNIDQMIRTHDPEKLLNKMNTVQGIRDLNKVLSKTPDGKKLFNDLKRVKFDQTIGNNLIDSVTQQAKLGTFSKLLEKGKNKEIIKEILGSEGFKRLERLQRNAGYLADAANKFYNSSQSGTVATDAAILAKGISDLAHFLMGNPWPFSRTLVGVLGARKLSGLLSDPEFLKLVENIILSSKKNDQKALMISFQNVAPYILKVKQNTDEEQKENTEQQTKS